MNRSAAQFERRKARHLRSTQRTNRSFQPTGRTHQRWIRWSEERKSVRRGNSGQGEVKPTPRLFLWCKHPLLLMFTNLLCYSPYEQTTIWIICDASQFASPLAVRFKVLSPIGRPRLYVIRIYNVFHIHPVDSRNSVLPVKRFTLTLCWPIL